MACKVACVRCEQRREGLERPPMGRPGGQNVLENVCRDCWQEWRQTSDQLINHYGLVLGNPDHRKKLRQAMREFLNLDEGEAREGGPAIPAGRAACG